MDWKDILIHVDGSRATSDRLRVVAGFAARRGARLVGLHVVEPFLVRSWAEVQIPSEILEAQRTLREDAAGECERIFRAAVDEAGIESQWHRIDGDLAGSLITQARCADLVVLGAPRRDDPLSLTEGLADHVLLGSGRPVLVLSETPCIEGPDTTIMVAWNARREAARALADALPLLATAARVEIVGVKIPGKEVEPTATEVCAHLARHGVSATAVTLDGRTAPAGELLLGHARECGASVLVMGGYGHSRMRETILGGVTSQVLGDGGITTLLSH